MLRLNHHTPARNIYVLISFVTLLFFFAPAIAQEQVGRPLITNYRYQDYEAGPANWWAVEDKDGVMYFANGAGVLIYDGVNWKVVEDSGCRSLAMDDKGTIYVGRTGDLGYLEPQSNGELKYISLKDQIPEEHRVFQDVWELDFFRGKIIYRTEFKLYVWDGESFEIIESKDAYHVGKIVHDTYYLRIWGRGLCYLNDENIFEVVPGGERFADERIYVILPYDEERLLIGTRTQGFFIYDGKTFQPFKTEADDLIEEALYLPGVALDNGQFLLNTFSDGAYLIDHDGKLLQKYTTDNGLQDGSADYAFVDSRNILWMMLFNGISSVNLNTSLTVIDSDMGLSTNVVFSVYKFRDIVYMGTNNGIYTLSPGENEVKFMEGTYGQGRVFIEFNGRLFTGTSDMGFMEIDGYNWKYVRESINYDLRVNNIVRSRLDTNRIFISHNQGLASFYYNSDIKQFEMEDNTLDIILDNQGNFEENEDGSAWISTLDNENKIRRLIPKFENGKINLKESELKIYDPKDGLSEGNVGFWRHDEEIHFFVANEDEPTESFQFNPETDRFEKKEFYYVGIDNENGVGNFPPVKDSEGKLWVRIGGQIYVNKKDENGEYQLGAPILKELTNSAIWWVFPEDPKPDGTQIVWFNGPDGVIRYEGNLEETKVPEFKTLIRSIKTSNDSILYAGFVDLPKKLQLDSDENTVSFDFAAPLFIAQNQMQYRTYLQGLDKDWSDWSKQANREYINLPPGKYNFKVKAKSQFGDETEEASIEFSISPPWYKTWWAYALYVLGFLLLVYAIVRSRTRILVNQRKALEDKVEERTREVSQRLEELATINQVGQALTEKLELTELIQMVGNEMKKVFKSDITYLALLDSENGVINFPFQDGDNMAPMKFGEGLTSKIIQTGEALLINHDTDIEAEYQKSGLEQTGKKAISYLGVPIPVEDKIIGVLSVQSTKQASRFSEEDKRLLNTIAINVGVALHNAELYEEAKVAKAKAEDANEAKSAFLSTVSHELRTPLTSVLGFAKIIRKRLEDKVFPAVTVEDQKIKRTMKQVSENLNVVVSEGERLTNLINDVLDLAKIESGRMEWHMKPVFLQDVINRAIASTSTLFEQKGLTLKKNISSDLPLVSADEDKLIQVVINLLSNAVKFTDKGKVSIDAYQDEGQIMVEVQDTGIGIADDDKHKVFERFRQAGDTLTDKPQGTGLGLPICREIIEHHGGIIWMKSDLGVGSTFFFSIPTMGDTGSEQPIQLDRILNSLKKQIKHSSLSDVKKSPTILVVDDDTPIRSLLRQELGDAGYQVQEAANGKAALDMVRMSKPDLIILDVMMPEINGFDVAAVLKNDPATMDIPIIILSIVQDKERGLKIGVDRYLTKPINTEQLFHEVDELLEQGVSKKKVLVVDEDASAVKTLSEVLNARGYKVLESEPKDLIKNATESKPDIIMLNSVYNGDQKLIKDLKVQKGMENTMFFIYE